MSKIAAARSFGAKGVVAITLERPTYQPGETLVGYITLRVDKGFNAKELQVAIIGDELVTWEIAGEQHERSRNWLRDHQVIAAPQRYEPGDYVFPFQFLLPYDLPNSFEYQETRVYDIADVHACVGYTITASLPVLGPLNSDLGGSQGGPDRLCTTGRTSGNESHSQERSRRFRSLRQGILCAHSVARLKLPLSEREGRDELHNLEPLQEAREASLHRAGTSRGDTAA